jgi:hypothetical protein
MVIKVESKKFKSFSLGLRYEFFPGGIPAQDLKLFERVLIHRVFYSALQNSDLDILVPLQKCAT